MFRVKVILFKLHKWLIDSFFIIVKMLMFVNINFPNDQLRLWYHFLITLLTYQKPSHTHLTTSN